jgi:spore germination protein YaaH
MKQRPKTPIFIVVLVGLLFTFGFSSPAQTGQLLAQGAYGPEVSSLQQKLKQLGYFQAFATGYYGPLTERAVRELQKDYGLLTDGIAGPQTKSTVDCLLQNPKNRQRIVQGYYTGAEGPLPSSAPTFSKQGNSLTTVAPFWYQIDPEGSGQINLSSEVTKKEINDLVGTARAKNVKVLALVHNLVYNSNINGREVAHQVLASKKNRSALINSILRVIQENGLAGVEIDIENIYPRDRELFNQFIKELSGVLTNDGYYLSVALPARLDGQKGASWSDSFDYATVGFYADQVVIMAYDEHGNFSGAGPIASLPWVEKVIASVLKEIPPAKVVLGIPAYGFDWSSGQPAPRYISYLLAMQTAGFYHQALNWDSRAQVPFFRYTDENGSSHEVYFENASSWAGKIDLVAKYNLRGVAIWRLGLEDPQGWEVLKSKFPVRKL